MHSYSVIPGSVAAHSLGKAERASRGQTTSILGQIFIASVLAKGGDGRDLVTTYVTTFGGQMSSNIRAEVCEYHQRSVSLDTRRHATYHYQMDYVALTINPGNRKSDQV